MVCGGRRHLEESVRVFEPHPAGRGFGRKCPTGDALSSGRVQATGNLNSPRWAVPDIARERQRRRLGPVASSPCGSGGFQLRQQSHWGCDERQRTRRRGFLQAPEWKPTRPPAPTGVPPQVAPGRLAPGAGQGRWCQRRAWRSITYCRIPCFSSLSVRGLGRCPGKSAEWESFQVYCPDRRITISRPSTCRLRTDPDPHPSDGALRPGPRFVLAR